MRGPSLPEILRHHDRSITLMIVADIEHDRSVAEQRRLTLIAAGVAGITHRPTLTVIATDHDRREGLQPFAPRAALNGHNERSIGQTESRLRSRCKQPPVLLLQLASQVFRRGPGESIVLRADHQKLRGLADLEARFGTVARPLMLARLAAHPDGEAEDLARLLIHDDARIAAPILFLRQPAVLPHVHDDTRRRPRSPAVRTAAEPDVDVFLQVASRPPPHVVDRQQRPFRRGRQCGNAVSMHAVVVVLSQCDADPLPSIRHIIARLDVPDRRLDRCAARDDLMLQVGSLLQPRRQPEDVVPFEQLAIDRHNERRLWSDRLANRSRRRKRFLPSRREQPHRFDIPQVISSL